MSNQKQLNIGIVVGSLRKDSYSKAVANYFVNHSDAKATFKLLDISALPLYNQDWEENSPEPWLRFRQEVAPLDGILFVTPEHNRSIPTALKNALDIASRPYGHSVWNGKPAGIISVSPGAMGAFGANHHLRQILTFLNMPTMQQPEAYIGNITASLNEKGEVNAEKLIGFLEQYRFALLEWFTLILKR